MNETPSTSAPAVAPAPNPPTSARASTRAPVDLGDRRTYLGASDAASALGLSRYKTPYQLYQEKVGELPMFEGNNRTRRGIALEPFIALEYERRHNVTLVTPAEMVHPKHEFIRAHLDRLVEGKPELFVEIKTAARGDGWGEPGSDAIPEDYLAQIAVQFACYPAGQTAHIAADLGGTDDVEFVVARNDRLSDSVVEQLVEFWQRNVLGKVPPDPVTEADCKRRWAASKGKTLVATPEVEELLNVISNRRHMKAEFDKGIKEAELELRKVIQDADTVIDEHGLVLATFKEQSRAAYEVKASSFRVLRIKGGE